MLRGRIFLCLLIVSFISPPLRAAEQLVIRVEAKGWGDAVPEDIHKVLASAGRELLQYIPLERPIRVRVVSTADAPQVDYRRARDGEFTVRLAVQDQYWAQFAFQFAHELGHIASHYERRSDNKLGAENQWFEEAVCEAASLFVLTRMAETWKVNPPYRNWKTFASPLADYATKRVKGIEAPNKDRMPAWFSDNRAALRADPYLRDRNRVVAAHLFRMLERDPERWEAFRYLNLGRPDPGNSFESYLENWYFSVPRAHKPFVKGVADLLGVKSELIAGHAVK
jgi:hypothetical protein